MLKDYSILKVCFPNGPPFLVAHRLPAVFIELKQSPGCKHAGTQNSRQYTWLISACAHGDVRAALVREPQFKHICTEVLREAAGEAVLKAVGPNRAQACSSLVR